MNEKDTAYQSMMLIFSQYDGVNLRVNKNGNFVFPVYVLDKYKDVDIEVLDLSPRSYNCLKRAKISSVYELMTGITGRQDLLRIRNCGANSSREIMVKLFLFQFAQMKADQRDWYIKKIIEKNQK